jgi:hypothetical protein
MPINSASQDPGRNFLLNPVRNDKTAYLTLVVSTSLAFLFTLAIYAWGGHSPFPRLGYGIFVSVVPALGALLLFKLARLSMSWRWVAMIYIGLFVVILVVQAFGRMIHLNN